MYNKTLSRSQAKIFYCLVCLFVVYLSAFGQPKSDTLHIVDFGARGNGKTDCTSAFQKAAKKLAESGGVLVIDPGTYLVGQQQPSHVFGAGNSFMDEPILSFNKCRYPITILGYRATLKARPGLKYGSFNPVTGKPDSIRIKGHRSDYYASAYTFINAVACASITIRGLTLDGNSGQLQIGPGFGSEGIQLSATGLRLYNNLNVLVRDCSIHHCALDGVLIGWTGLTETMPAYPHVLENVRSMYNGRQGISWVGGNSLRVTNSEFSSTGKAKNQRAYVVSPPSAGIDIEIEESVIKNGLFVNCTVSDNSGPGISSIGHATKNIRFRKCTFIGTTNSAVYPKSEGFGFDSCVFVGKVERIFGSKDPGKAIYFSDCIFSMEKNRSPSGLVFGEYCEFYEGENVLFDRCSFKMGEKKLPVFNQRELTFKDCTFEQNNAADYTPAAIFKGNNVFKMSGKGLLNLREASVEGKIMLNDMMIRK